MATLTHPGLYVIEEPSGVRPIAGASTSIGMFVGRAQKGPINVPTRLTNFTEFDRTFGDNSTISDTARYIRMFFLNGGSDLYMMRIANGASNASVTLRTEDTTPILQLTAKSAGASGEALRARVWYAGEEPEGRFNMELYSWVPNSAGVMVAEGIETFQNLTMQGDDPLYAPDYLTQESALVDASDLGDPVTDAQNGYSLSGRFVPINSRAAAQTAFATIFDSAAGTPGGTHLRLSVDGLPYVTLDLTDRAAAIAAVSAGSVTDLINNEVITVIQDRVTSEYNSSGFPGVTVTCSMPAQAEDLHNGAPPSNIDIGFLRITSATGGDIKIRPATTGKDLSVPLMMGPGNGGLEIGAHSHRRPTPNGIQLRVSDEARMRALGFLQKQDLIRIDLDGADADGNPVTRQVDVPLAAGAIATDSMVVDSFNPASSSTGNSDGLRQLLMAMRDALNADAEANPKNNPWRATLAGLRLSLTSASADDLVVPTVETSPTAVATIHAEFASVNVPRFQVGAGGTAGTQIPAPGPATDGSPPLPADYDDAYSIIDREVKIFNMMVLPPDREIEQDMNAVLGPAAAFCRSRRAVLFVDPPSNIGPQEMSSEVNNIRTGMPRDYAALFYPRILINEDGREVPIGPAGAMAGLAARTDATRGIYKAPAGQDLPLYGVVGVQRELSNGEVGMLNPRGVNCITRAPAGVRPWGTRTLDGDDDFASEWKYIPVRRTALFIEQSLFDGLQWVVFEPNGDILWSQIRLNVGAFMQRLFRQGFFKGEKKNDAYFVKCDSETTTQADIDLGVVNIWVGFAPLKPAEFVIVHLQQMAGQQDA